MNPDVQKEYDELNGKSRAEIEELLALSKVQGFRQRACLRLIAEMDDRVAAQNESKLREIVQRLEVLEKPHWTTTPNFWLTAAGVLLAGLAAWFGWIEVRPLLLGDAAAPTTGILTPVPAGIVPTPKEPESTGFPTPTDATSEQRAAGQAPSALPVP